MHQHLHCNELVLDVWFTGYCVGLAGFGHGLRLGGQLNLLHIILICFRVGVLSPTLVARYRYLHSFIISSLAVWHCHDHLSFFHIGSNELVRNCVYRGCHQGLSNDTRSIVPRKENKTSESNLRNSSLRYPPCVHEVEFNNKQKMKMDKHHLSRVSRSRLQKHWRWYRQCVHLPKG